MNEIIERMNVADAGKPGPTGNVSLTRAYKDTVTLSWSPPLDVGKSQKLCKYYVDKLAASHLSWEPAATVAGTTTTATITKLDRRETYLFRLRAENAMGIGPAEELPYAIATITAKRE